MKKIEQRPADARIEVVTTTFVASGRPEGIGDLSECLAQLNRGAASRQIVIMEPAVRPLYRASDQLHLNAPLLIKCEEIVFANFEGPSLAEPIGKIEAPALLLAPPFQIQGSVAFAAGSEPAQALRGVIESFFVVRKASVFDADGNALGEGEQIIVNGSAVQMSAITRQHITVPVATARAAQTVGAVEDPEAAGHRRAA